MLIGIFLICLGLLFLMDNLGFIQGKIWDYVWPVFFIVLGASLILKRASVRGSEDE